MTDWKTIYSNHWTAAAERENRLALLTSNETGIQFNPNGIGAGLAIRVEGFHGGADFLSSSKRTFLEITGPHVHLPQYYPLWIRPDKFETATREYLNNGRITVILHEVPPSNTVNGLPLIRSIVLAGRSAKRWRAGDYTIQKKTLHGIQQDYTILKTTDRQIASLSATFAIIVKHEIKGE